MTPYQLSAIRARAEKATKGPWSVDTDGEAIQAGPALICRYPVPEDFPCLDPNDDNYEDVRLELFSNAQFIAHSREDVPALITAYENVSADLKEALNALRLLHDNQNGCPLEKYEKDWNEAMALTERILEAHSA
jgi:hypothetical protein